jgi:hypothetical protein
VKAYLTSDAVRALLLVKASLENQKNTISPLLVCIIKTLTVEFFLTYMINAVPPGPIASYTATSDLSSEFDVDKPLPRLIAFSITFLDTFARLHNPIRQDLSMYNTRLFFWAYLYEHYPWQSQA